MDEVNKTEFNGNIWDNHSNSINMTLFPSYNGYWKLLDILIFLKVKHLNRVPLLNIYLLNQKSIS